MKIILVDKQEKLTHIFTCKSEASKLLNVSPNTLWNWSKHKIKETERFIVCFNIEEHVNKNLVRHKTFPVYS